MDKMFVPNVSIIQRFHCTIVEHCYFAFHVNILACEMYYELSIEVTKGNECVKNEFKLSTQMNHSLSDRIDKTCEGVTNAFKLGYECVGPLINP